MVVDGAELVTCGQLTEPHQVHDIQGANMVVQAAAATEETMGNGVIRVE